MLVTGCSVSQKGETKNRTDFSISNILSSPGDKCPTLDKNSRFVSGGGAASPIPHHSIRKIGGEKECLLFQDREDPKMFPFLRLVNQVTSTQKPLLPQTEMTSNFSTRVSHRDPSTFFVPSRENLSLPPWIGSVGNRFNHIPVHGREFQSMKSSFSVPSSPDIIHRPMALRPASGGDHGTPICGHRMMTEDYSTATETMATSLTNCYSNKHKLKRLRTAFSTAQMSILEKTFKSRHYVIGERRKQLASALGLSETQVKVWFQNRRTKYKKLAQDSSLNYE